MLAAGRHLGVGAAAVVQHIAQHPTDALGVGRIKDIAGFAPGRDQSGLFKLRQMKRKSRCRNLKLAGNVALRHALRTGPHQQAHQIQPIFMGQR